MAANARICVKVDATKADAADYVAFVESATLTNGATGAATVIVSGRSYAGPAPTAHYAGSWFNNDHFDGDPTADYVDYLTFFIDPDLRPAEGATAPLTLVMTVAYHHVATGRRVLAETTRVLLEAGEDETVLDIGTTTPALSASGDAAVDATLTFGGLALDHWHEEPVLLAIKDAVGTVSEDQVRVNSVARADDGAAVGVEVSGVDEAGAHDIVVALEHDVASGSFYFRLLMNGVAAEDVHDISITYIDTRSTPSQVVEVEVAAAVVLDNVDAGAFNADAGAQTQFKKAIVAAVMDVTSTDQVTNLVAKSARRRLASSGSTSAIVEYTLSITKVVYEELAIVETFELEYLEEVTTALAAATADAYFIEILQAEDLFADASVDVGATYTQLKAATIDAEPVAEDEEEAPADDAAEPKTAGLPLVTAVVGGAALLGAATGAFLVSKYREAHQTERISPEVYVKDIDLEGR